MASYDRHTDDDEVQWSKELIVMGRRMRKLGVHCFYVHDGNIEKLSKSFDRSWGFEGYGCGSRTNTRWITPCGTSE
jgi:hypothetical protein